jgi:DNA-binding transcriptional ArsR family regulator
MVSVIVSQTLDRTTELATVLQALSDPIRLQIVAALADGGERACGSFGLPVTKSTCSHHFRVLREAGVISQRVDGKNRLNRLSRTTLDERFPGLLDAVLRACGA